MPLHYSELHTPRLLLARDPEPSTPHSRGPVQKEKIVSQQTAAALGKLLTLFGTCTLIQDLGDLLEDGFLSGSQAAALRSMQYTVSPG